MNLNEKEKQIIELKASGHTVEEIARCLATSKAYAEQMIHNLYNKTGTRNGPALVSWGYVNGVLQINRENLPSPVKKAG